METTTRFQSIFKINNVSIMPPVIDQQTRDDIKKIRELVAVKELKWQKRKEEKDRVNIAKKLEKNAEPMRKRCDSYTLLLPTFASNLLPKISIETSDSDKETIIDVSSKSFTSEISIKAADKSSKDLKNEIDRRSSTPFQEASLAPEINNQLKELIAKQKQEYLKAMETLKNKFTNEQHDLMMNLQSNLLVTSTPLNSSIITIPSTTEDEEFTEFKTCLQSQSISLKDKTIVNDHESKVRMQASVVINAFARGFLTRKLMQTIYVQEHMRNIKETLQLVLNLEEHHAGKGSPVQSILLKARLFRQLQNDLYSENEK